MQFKEKGIRQVKAPRRQGERESYSSSTHLLYLAETEMVIHFILIEIFVLFHSIKGIGVRQFLRTQTTKHNSPRINCIDSVMYVLSVLFQRLIQLGKMQTRPQN